MAMASWTLHYTALLLFMMVPSYSRLFAWGDTLNDAFVSLSKALHFFVCLNEGICWRKQTRTPNNKPPNSRIGIPALYRCRIIFDLASCLFVGRVSVCLLCVQSQELALGFFSPARISLKRPQEELVVDVNSSTPWWMLSKLLCAFLAIKDSAGLKEKTQCSDCSHNDTSHLHLLHEHSMINLWDTNDGFLLNVVLLYECNSYSPQGNIAQSSGSFQELDLHVLDGFFIEKQSSFCPFQNKMRRGN